ncbi:uncharacterized protein K452DRAFT_85251 [Aplosporella prunicola CBS 121167]|uniref:Uncharacterized protein n=1 Tax=Aplosporella prunicola CBS 121167 TaxID=1176127 RepID=A0A6A6B3N6_9PEZI|nr:uncharacterized protein K452DRAFT_85251 [Aplosporella prunicola CBS 121167]KAF2138852.1 hypothetical protein K452DRAFT_85251 [Aplosporella prunicola CBS 121167]
MHRHRQCRHDGHHGKFIPAAPAATHCNGRTQQPQQQIKASPDKPSDSARAPGPRSSPDPMAARGRSWCRGEGQEARALLHARLHPNRRARTRSGRHARTRVRGAADRPFHAISAVAFWKAVGPLMLVRLAPCAEPHAPSPSSARWCHPRTLDRS